MITALIIDDEESTVHVVKHLLDKNATGITHIHTAVGSLNGVEAIREYKPELLFLDIEMPVMSGFDVLQLFPEHTFKVIFITAYNHYAIKAIKYSAFDYLLKPIDEEELLNAVKKFMDVNASEQSEKEKYKNLMYNLTVGKPGNYRLSVSTTEGTHFLSTNDIIRLEADGNYTRFHLNKKKSFITSKTLKEYDELLTDQDFIRVHRAHLVNKNYVQRITAPYELLMEDQSVVEVSRRKWDIVKRILHT
jgi:two-component system LytT family response regulator